LHLSIRFHIIDGSAIAPNRPYTGHTLVYKEQVD